MFAVLMRKLADAMVDSFVRRLLQEPYTESIYSIVANMQKVSLRATMEAWMRAETGKPINRPLGSPIVLSEWQKLLLNPVHLTRLPTPDGVRISTAVTIGPRARKPLKIEIPMMITGMSWGSSLSTQAKVALARAATMAGTATNSGEAPLVPQERAAARLFIGQYNRGGFMNDPDSLRQLDAIEIQLGQGAQGAAPMTTSAIHMDDDFRRMHRLKPGQDSVIHSRLPGVDDQDKFMDLVDRLRADYGVPVGLKFAANHWLERELDVAIDAGVDYVVIDGAEAGTHGGPTALQDDMGLPTLFALARATRHLRRRGRRDDISVIAAGGLFTPGHFLKALALGADACYIGTIAIIAMVHTQATKSAPWEPLTEVVLYQGKFKEDLNVEQAAEHLAKFLKSCTDEMRLVCYALGKSDVRQLGREDLVCVDAELARALDVDYAGLSPDEQRRILPALDGAEAREAADARDRARETSPSH